MNYRMSFYFMGKILICGGIIMLPSAAVSLIYNDGQLFSFILSILVFFALGVPGVLQKPKRQELYARDGALIVAFTWILYSLIGGLPFFISGQIPSFTDCFFETVSGFTTTGSTILTDVEALSPSLLFWRSFTHWIGGIGVLVFAMAIISQRNMGATFILRAEIPGLKVGKMASKWQYSMRILCLIYVVLSLMEFIFLLFGGMNVFESMVHTFGTAGTGGFGVKNASIGYYNSTYIDYVIGIFMLIFGTNFNIYYFLITKKWSAVLKNEEFWVYIGIALVSSLLIAVNIMPEYKGFLTSFRYSFFQVSSVMTTTGYATADFNQWPAFSKMILVLLMFIGASAGSTGGGLKVIRAVVLVKTAFLTIKKNVRPDKVITIKSEGKPMEENIAVGVGRYFAVYMLLIGISVLIVSLDDFDMTTTVTSVIATINNIGPGLEAVGPIGNFSEFGNLSKIILSFDMLAGRLELYPILMILLPSTWRHN